MTRTIEPRRSLPQPAMVRAQRKPRGDAADRPNAQPAGREWREGLAARPAGPAWQPPLSSISSDRPAPAWRTGGRRAGQLSESGSGNHAAIG
jgi:hypothetical protein